MKKRTHKKLVVTQTTLRLLSSHQLAGAQGALLFKPNTTNCPLSTAACPGSFLETRCNCPPPSVRGPGCD